MSQLSRPPAAVTPANPNPNDSFVNRTLTNSAPPAAVTYDPILAGPAVGYQADQAGPAVGYDAAQGQAYEYEAERGTTTKADANLRSVQEDELVQTQLERILAKDSPLMKRVASQGADFANDRGMLNSTMGAQASQAAMIDAALPIATADAAAIQTVYRDNQHYLNEIAVFNASEENAMTKFNVSEANRAASENAGRKTQVSLANTEFENSARQFLAAETNQTNRFNVSETNQQRAALAAETNQTNRFNASEANSAAANNASSANQMLLAGFDAEQRRILSSSDSARAVMAQFNEMSAAIAADPNLDGSGRQAAMANLLAGSQQSLALVGDLNGIENLDQYLDFEVSFDQPGNNGATPDNGGQPARPASPPSRGGNSNGGEGGSSGLGGGDEGQGSFGSGSVAA